jgi:hypothetical protein
MTETTGKPSAPFERVLFYSKFIGREGELAMRKCLLIFIAKCIFSEWRVSMH